MASRAQSLATLLVTRMRELDDATPDGDAFYDLENYAVEQLVGQTLATETGITDETIAREVFEAMPHRRHPAEGETEEFARYLTERFPQLDR